ncbi:hypothetical protein [Methanocella sp. MCL-LM]|uniref:hypothetical protein n=1 Tax=Methanocella sp. MCL-LM TaxID=3412035 RepID=UPI003C75DB2F
MSNGIVNIKEPIVSAVISFLIPGTGQMYNNQVKKGIVVLLGYIFMWIAVYVLYFVGGLGLTLLTAGIGSLALLCCFPMLFLPLLINVWAAYDAFKTSKRINTGEVIRDWFS